MSTNKIIDAVAWLLIIVGVIFIIWKLFGGSPTEINILVALVTGILLKMMSIGNHMSGLKVRIRNIESKFNALASDFKDHIKHK